MIGGGEDAGFLSLSFPPFLFRGEWQNCHLPPLATAAENWGSVFLPRGIPGFSYLPAHLLVPSCPLPVSCRVPTCTNGPQGPAWHLICPGTQLLAVDCGAVRGSAPPCWRAWSSVCLQPGVAAQWAQQGRLSRPPSLPGGHLWDRKFMTESGDIGWAKPKNLKVSFYIVNTNIHWQLQRQDSRVNKEEFVNDH